MAQPVLTRIGPTGGKAVGGYTVYIEGANFKDSPDEIPPMPLVGGLVDDDWPDTVKVRVNSVDAGRIEVLSSNLIRFKMPMFMGEPNDLPKSVNVEVSNLDEDGIPIDGETSLQEEWFIYRQKDLTRRTHLAAVIATLIHALRVGVIPNVSITTNIDWAEIPDDPARELKKASLPAIYIRPPKGREYKKDAELTAGVNEKANPDDDTAWIREDDPITATLIFDIVGVSDNIIEAINLSQAFLEWVKVYTKMKVLRDPANAESEEREYDFGLDQNGLPEFRFVGVLHQWVATVVVEGVQVTPEESLAVQEGSTIFAGTESDWGMGLPIQWLTFERKREG